MIKFLDCDPVVPYKFGQMSSSLLKNFMKDVNFISYRGLSHSSSEEELTDMKVSYFNFLLKIKLKTILFSIEIHRETYVNEILYLKTITQ